MTSEPLAVQAHAKLNVFLRVLAARDDGYHDIETLVLPVDVADTVTLVPADELSVEVFGEPVEIASGPENLAHRAARALAHHCDRQVDPLVDRLGAHIRIEKRIPVAGGMGGGSADAAATLRGLNALWACGLDDAELAEVAAAVGADVPALLHGGAVFADGRGTRVTPVHASTTWWAVKPFDFGVSSAEAYAWWDEEPTTGSDAGVLIAAVETGNVELLGPAIFNDLQAVVAGRHPQIGAVIDAFCSAGALGAVMTGSGPTVVALARNGGHAVTLTESVPGAFAVSGPVGAR